jgi:hypothetical protein
VIICVNKDVAMYGKGQLNVSEHLLSANYVLRYYSIKYFLRDEILASPSWAI